MDNQTDLTSATPSNPTVEHLIHVICLPLQLKRKSQAISQIDDVVPQLTADGSPWHLASGPFLEELTETQRWQARVYFHPFVCRFLFDPQRSRWLQRDDIKAIEVTLPKTWNLEPVKLKLKVLRCQLVIFQPDIACLLLELDYTATDTQPALQMHELQRLLDRLRRVYPPFFGCDNGIEFGGHCAELVELLDLKGSPIGEAGRYAPTDYQESLRKSGQERSWKPGWSAHWKTLLAPMYTDHTPDDGHSIGLRQFSDDRAAIMSYVAFNDPRALNPGQWTRLCFADDHGYDPLPYAKSFLADFEQRHCYDRYWYTGPTADPYDPMPDSRDNPSRVLNCGYAFSYVGKSKDWFFEQDLTGALFTFRHIYVPMGVIAHMQRAALLAASHRLTYMVQRKNDDIRLPDTEEVRKFYKQFIEFTQTYWFDEVSPQEQGQQIFSRWREYLRVQPLYDEVRQELRDLAEHSELQAGRIELEQSKKLNETVGRLGVFSLALATISAIAGIFGMNEFDKLNSLSLFSIFTAVLFINIPWLTWRVYQIKEVRALALSVLLGHHSSPSANTKP
ncbi:hypothetical protein [Propionivibrio sp.]|uniref:hypothetical protein n=1 Tax=Propionivibrio sp. TaxID=2212460 RepID=UPI003BF06DE2